MTYRLAWRDAVTDVTNVQNADYVLGSRRISQDQAKSLIYLKSTSAFLPGQVGTIDPSEPSGGGATLSSAQLQPLQGVASQPMQSQQYGWFYSTGTGIQAFVNGNLTAPLIMGSSGTPGSFGPAQPGDDGSISLVQSNLSPSSSVRTVNLR